MNFLEALKTDADEMKGFILISRRNLDRPRILMRVGENLGLLLRLVGIEVE